MPREIEIKTFLIAKTQVQAEAVREWMEHIGADEFELPGDEVSDPALLVALAAKNCYQSFQVGLNPNVTRVREDYVEYFDNILKSKHGSVLEHAVFSFAMVGISRVFTAEMNRHRAGWAISEQSLRFCRFGEEIPFWMPDSFKHDPNDSAEIQYCKERSRELFQDAFKAQEQAYRKLVNLWAMEDVKDFATKKKLTSAFRRIVGLGVATSGVWTGNVRALRHVFAMRCSPAAEEEMVHVFSNIVEQMKEAEPLLFGDFTDADGSWKPKYEKV